MGFIAKLEESMNSALEHLEWNDSWAYDHTKLHATQVFDLDGGWLLVNKAEDSNLFEFALFTFHSGPATKNGVVCSPEYWKLHMRGYGFTPGLRECRHIWFGENHKNPDGYDYYAPLELYSQAFKKLQEWFDD